MGEVDINYWYVIVNPTAGDGRSLQDFPLISKLLRDEGVRYEPIVTEHKFHAVELTVSAINNGYRKILVVGGDGTIHEVVNGLFIQNIVDPKDVLLGVIATGSLNNWVKSTGVPRKYIDAIRALKEGSFQFQDVGVISYEESQYRQSRYFANVAGIGFDAVITKKFTHLRNKGCRNAWRYTLKYLRYFFKYKCTGVKLRVDDQLIYNNLLMNIAIGIGRYNNLGLQQLPTAVIDDGLFDLSYTKPIHFWHILFRVRYLFNGRIGRIGHIKHARGTKIRVESTPEISVEVDGEILGESPFELSLIPKAIKIVVAK